MKKFIGTLTLIVFVAYACSKSSGDDDGGNNNPPPGNGNNNCDTTGMAYMADIVPILQNNCYRCHGSATNSGSLGIVLEGHGNLKPFAESGTLLGVISHAQGFMPMPQDASKLSDCNINKIRSWIENGMLNN